MSLSWKCNIIYQHYLYTYACVIFASSSPCGCSPPSKLDWGCGSCGPQSVPGRPAVLQSWQEEEEKEEVMWLGMTAKQTEREEDRDHYCRQLLATSLYQHEIRARCTHLMSWLYLARRSDRQGAPVFICRESFIMMNNWIHIKWTVWLFGCLASFWSLWGFFCLFLLY